MTAAQTSVIEHNLQYGYDKNPCQTTVVDNSSVIACVHHQII